MEKKLYRDEHRKVISGVCAGLAEYFGVDVSIVRVIFVMGLFLKGFVVLPYFVLWAVLPKRPFSFNDPNFKPGVTPGFNPKYPGFGDVHVDYTVPPPTPGQAFGSYPQPKKASNAGAIFGVVLIALGSLFLLDNLDFIPEFDFDRLWPVVLVVAGAALIFTGTKKHPWEKEGWQAEKKEAEFKTDAATETTEQEPTDNTPNI